MEIFSLFPKSFSFLFHCILYLFSLVPIVLLLENNNNKQSWFFSRYSGFYTNWCVLFVSPLNTVSEQDNENTLETLENQTTDENQTEETTTSFSVVVAVAVNARMSTTMDKWLSRLQKTSEINQSFLQSSAPPNQPSTPPTRRFFIPFLHLRPILLPTPRFMFCHLISFGHHRFCHQICMSSHPLILAAIPMLRILKFTQHLRLVNLRHIPIVTCKLPRE